MKEHLFWQDIERLVDDLCGTIIVDCNKNGTTPEETFEAIYGIPRGGLIIAVMMSHKLHIPLITSLNGMYGKKFLIVDDIADTGKTLEKSKKLEVCNKAKYATIHYHKQSVVEPEYWVSEKGDRWIVYPWELDDSDEIQDYLV